MNGPTCFLLALSAVAHCRVFKEVWGGTETKLKSRGMAGKGVLEERVVSKVLQVVTMMSGRLLSRVINCRAPST